MEKSKRCPYGKLYSETMTLNPQQLYLTSSISIVRKYNWLGAETFAVFTPELSSIFTEELGEKTENISTTD